MFKILLVVFLLSGQVCFASDQTSVSVRQTSEPVVLDFQQVCNLPMIGDIVQTTYRVYDSTKRKYIIRKILTKKPYKP